MDIDKVRTLIVYYSSTGTNYQLAQWAEEGARQEGAETRLVQVAEIAPKSVLSGTTG